MRLHTGNESGRGCSRHSGVNRKAAWTDRGRNGRSLRWLTSVLTMLAIAFPAAGCRPKADEAASRPPTKPPSPTQERDGWEGSRTRPDGVPDSKPMSTLPSAEMAAVPIEPSDRDDFASSAARPFAMLLAPGNEPDDWDLAHRQLLELGVEAVPFLIRKLSDGDEIERETAATTLALIGSDADEAVPALVNALNDPADFVRANAAAALVQFPEQQSLAARVLLSLLKSSDPHLRQMAGMNLTALDGESGIDVDELAGILEEETPPEVLVPVVELLGRIGPAAAPAIPKLRQITFDYSDDLGTAAAHAIQLITDESSERP